MIGASFGGTLNADSLQAGALFMRSEGQNKASFKVVVLRSAKIKGQIDMTGASFDGRLNANGLQVEGGLFMRSDGQNMASFKDVDLNSAKITGQIDMTGASFDGELYADSLQDQGDLFMPDPTPKRSSWSSRMSAAIWICAAPPWPVSISRARQSPGTCGSAGQGPRSGLGRMGNPGPYPSQHAYRQSDGREGCLAGSGTPPSRWVQLQSSRRI